MLYNCIALYHDQRYSLVQCICDCQIAGVPENACLTFNLSRNLINVTGYRSDLSHNLINMINVAGYRSDLSHNLINVAGYRSDLSHNLTNVAGYGSNLSHNLINVAGYGSNLTHNLINVTGYRSDVTHNLINVTSYGSDLTLNLLNLTGYGSDLSQNLDLRTSSPVVPLYLLFLVCFVIRISDWDVNNVPFLQAEDQWLDLETDINTAIEKRLADILRDWDDDHKLFQVVNPHAKKHFPLYSSSPFVLFITV